MSPLQTDITEQAVQGMLTTATRSVYLQHTDTRAIADKPLQSHSYHIHHGLTQQVPSKGTPIHSISSELPDECAEPFPGSAGTVFFMGEQSAQLLGQRAPCLTAHHVGKAAPKHLSVGPGACSTDSVEVLGWIGEV